MNYPICSGLAARDEDSQKEEQNGKLGDEYDGYIGDLDAVRNLARAMLRYPSRGQWGISNGPSSILSD